MYSVEPERQRIVWRWGEGEGEVVVFDVETEFCSSRDLGYLVCFAEGLKVFFAVR